MKYFLPLLLLPGLHVTCGRAWAQATAQAAPVFSVDAYGARADNATVNTEYFRATLAAAAAFVANNPGVRVTVQALSNGTYITGAFNITERVTLEGISRMFLAPLLRA